MKKEAAPQDRPEAGLHLVMGDQGRVVRSAPIRNAPRRFLQPPFLTPRTLKQITEPMLELVLDVLDRSGRRLDSFGWPWAVEAFFDRPLGEVLQGVVAFETLQVGRLESRQPLRALRVPIRKSATFLLFSQSLVRFEQSNRLPMQRMGLTLYALVSPVPPVPRLPIPDANLFPEALPDRAPLVTSR